MKRLPTIDEFKELVTKCTWIWNDAMSGYTIKGPNSNSIFLPAGGWRSDLCSYDVNVKGLYWSSSFDTNSLNYAYQLYFNSSCVKWSDCSYRSLKKSIRLVSDTEGVDLGLSVKWNDKNVGAIDRYDRGDYFNYNEALKLNSMKKPEIKAGMLVEAGEFKYLVIPNWGGKLVGISSNSAWHSDIPNAENITKIGWPNAYHSNEKFTFGTVLWEKPNEIILSMQEIADKFGIPVEQLKIKK